MTSQFWARMPSFQKPDEALIPKNSALVPALIDLYLFFFSSVYSDEASYFLWSHANTSLD